MSRSIREFPFTVSPLVHVNFVLERKKKWFSSLFLHCLGSFHLNFAFVSFDSLWKIEVAMCLGIDFDAWNVNSISLHFVCFF